MSKLESLTIGKYMTKVRHEGVVEGMQASLKKSIFSINNEICLHVFKYLNLTRVLAMAQLCRQINILLQENFDVFTALETEEDW